MSDESLVPQGEVAPSVRGRVVPETPRPLPVTPVPVLQSSDAVDGIISALAQAQLKFRPVSRDRVAKVSSARADYTYRYADLASVIASVRPALNEQGIALVQSANVINGDRAVLLQVDTRFLHTSGQWIGSVLRLPLNDATPQTMGSLLTYLRRYGLSALAGVASEDDDDGEQAQKSAAPKRATATKPEPPPPPKTFVQLQQQADEPPAPKAVKPKADPLPLGEPGTITSRDRALLFKQAKFLAWSEQDVKALIKQRYQYDSTSQLTPGELQWVMAAMEFPETHGVSFETLDGKSFVVVRA
jgi:hypothetical protein